MSRCYKEPIAITLMPGCQVEAVRDIRFSEIQASCGLMPSLIGREDAPLERIEFNGCNFRIGDFDRSEGPGRSSNVGFVSSSSMPYFKHVRDLRMINTTFTTD